MKMVMGPQRGDLQRSQPSIQGWGAPMIGCKGRLSSRLRTNRPTANGLLHFIGILGTSAYYEFSGGFEVVAGIARAYSTCSFVAKEWLTAQIS